MQVASTCMHWVNNISMHEPPIYARCHGTPPLVPQNARPFAIVDHDPPDQLCMPMVSVYGPSGLSMAL